MNSRSKKIFKFLTLASIVAGGYCCDAQNVLIIKKISNGKTSASFRLGSKLFLDSDNSGLYSESKINTITPDSFTIKKYRGRTMYYDAVNIHSKFTIKKNTLRRKIIGYAPIVFLGALANIYGARLISGSINTTFVISAPIVLGIAIAPWIIPRKKYKVDNIHYKAIIE